VLYSYYNAELDAADKVQDEGARKKPDRLLMLQKSFDSVAVTRTFSPFFGKAFLGNNGRLFERNCK